MNADAVFFIVLVFLAGFILLIRAFGAWMFRINDVITELKKNNEILIHIARQQGIDLQEKR